VIPTNDFACISQPYQFDFKAFDEDGDSLAYSLSVPLNSSSASPVPTPQPREFHVNVALADRIDPDVLIPGTPGASIAKDGLFQVSPSTPGLHVYAIEVREYRNGVEIGKVVRDYQLLAIDGCVPQPDVPPIGVLSEDGLEVLKEEADFDFSLSDGNCITFIVGGIGNDITAFNRILPLNFDQDLADNFVVNENVISSDSSHFIICVPRCE